VLTSTQINIHIARLIPILIFVTSLWLPFRQARAVNRQLVILYAFEMLFKDHIRAEEGIEALEEKFGVAIRCRRTFLGFGVLRGSDLEILGF